MKKELPKKWYIRQSWESTKCGHLRGPGLWPVREVTDLTQGRDRKSMHINKSRERLGLSGASPRPWLQSCLSVVIAGVPSSP